MKSKKPKITKSNILYSIAEKIIPSGGQTYSKGVSQFTKGIAPKYLESGKGAYATDVDGNKYIDYVMACQPLILGYSDPDVNKAIIKQLHKGSTFSLHNKLEIDVAKLLIEIVPSAEMVRFGKNGSDVLAAAVRLARYITKKEKVLSCGWHGIHDWSLANTSRNGGIPEKIRKLSLKFEFNNIDNLNKIIKKNKNEISCIVMDLCARYYPSNNYLQKVKELAQKNKIILIFDEVVTGFRMHPGGAQSFFNVTPDLSCFGKGIANGFPISALVGKKKYMVKANELFYSLTFAGETISLAAANAALKEYKEKKLAINLETKGKYLIKLISEIFKNHNLQDYFKTEGMPCRPIFSLNSLRLNPTKIDLINFDLIRNLAKKNILYNGSVFICKTHTFKNLKYFSEMFEETIVDIKKKFKL